MATPQDWFLTADEFRRGVLSLEQYLPPLAISHKQFIEFVKPFCNFHGKIGRRGFQGVIACAMRQKQMNQISNAISRHSCSWNSETIGALLLGSAGLLREVWTRKLSHIAVCFLRICLGTEIGHTNHMLMHLQCRGFTNGEGETYFNRVSITSKML